MNKYVIRSLNKFIGQLNAYLLQQQITVQDRIPKTATMRKGPMITYIRSSYLLEKQNSKAVERGG